MKNKAEDFENTLFTWDVRSWSRIIAVALMVFLSNASLVHGRSLEPDDGSIDTGADERTQRMEMLRATNPSVARPQTVINPNTYSYTKRIQPPSVQSRPHHPADPSQSFRMERRAKPQASVVPRSEQVAVKHRVEKAITQPTPSHKVHRGILSHKKTAAAQKAASSKAKRSSANQSRPAPKCGFCLVNGYLYCGNQGVSLDSLIKQNRMQKNKKTVLKRKNG